MAGGLPPSAYRKENVGGIIIILSSVQSSSHGGGVVNALDLNFSELSYLIP
jgi:hypothetical protein